MTLYWVNLGKAWLSYAADKAACPVLPGMYCSHIIMRTYAAGYKDHRRSLPPGMPPKLT